MEKLNNFEREILRVKRFRVRPLVFVPSLTSTFIIDVDLTLLDSRLFLLPFPSKTCLKWTNQDHIKTLHTFNILFFCLLEPLTQTHFSVGVGELWVLCVLHGWKHPNVFPSLSFAVAEDDFSSISIFIHHPTKGSRIDRVPRHDDDVDWRKLSIIVGAHHFTLHSHWFDARLDRKKGEGKNIAWIHGVVKRERERGWHRNINWIGQSWKFFKYLKFKRDFLFMSRLKANRNINLRCLSIYIQPVLPGFASWEWKGAETRSGCLRNPKQKRREILCRLFTLFFRRRREIQFHWNVEFDWKLHVSHGDDLLRLALSAIGTHRIYPSI